MKERKCFCGETFIPNAPNQKYHDPECYRQEMAKRKRVQPRNVACAYDGCHTFEATNSQVKFCPDCQCAQKHRADYQRRREEKPDLFDQPLEFKTLPFKRLPDGFSVIVINDLHIPFQDIATVACVERFWDSLKPDLEIYAGDIMDCYQLSVFSANPSRQFSLQDEFDATESWLRKRVSKNPNARRVFMEGNHEDRLRRWMWKLGPAVSSLRSNTIEEQLKLKELEFEHLTWRSIVRILGCEIQHGYRASRSAAMPQNVAQLMARATNSSGICGHTHRVNQVNWTDTRGSHSYRENGCLCRMDLEYAPFPNWQHSFSFAEVHHNQLHLTTVPIYPKGFIANGKFYARV